jgi:glycosyltransferase involved in cell wall biosynthesis
VDQDLNHGKTGLDGSLKSICIATPDFEPLTQVGGIGTHYSALTQLLSKNGWDVTVLLCPQELTNRIIHEKRKREPGLRIYDATALGDVRGELRSIMDLQYFAIKRSQVMHNALQALTKERGREFDLIEFPDGGGTGFIPVQMKRNYRAYQTSRIIVKLHGSWTWVESDRPSLTISDLKRYYLEQYSFENADIQVSSSNYLLNWYRSHGWGIKSDASVCRLNPSGITLNDAHRNLTEQNEIIFFGIFAETKGVREFIEALNYIAQVDTEFPSHYSISFVGKFALAPSEKEILNRLHKYEVKVHSFATREEAIDYLHNKARLVVIPSRIDNSPNTILECMLTKIPFVTSRSGGIPEMLGVKSELYESVSCSIENPRNLPTLIQRHLKQDNAYTNQLLDIAYARGKSLINPEKILQWYEQRLHEPDDEQPQNPRRQQEEEFITIIIPTKNDRKYLETALNALLNQTYKNFKLIINESKTESKGLLGLETFVKKFPNAKLIQKDNFSQGEAMNQALLYVDTKYFMCIDDDNISKPNMIETFLHTMAQRNDAAVLSSYFTRFTNDEETEVLDSLKPKAGIQFIPSLRYYEHIGPCLPALLFENTQGDTNSIYLTEAVRTVGGWSESKNCQHDYELFLKLVGAGYTLDVIPEVLYYYRVHEGNRSRDLKDVGHSNPTLVESIVQSRPELITRNYQSLHKLAVASQTEPKSALYLLNVRLAELTAKSPRLRRLLEFSGNIIRKAIEFSSD